MFSKYSLAGNKPLLNSSNIILIRVKSLYYKASLSQIKFFYCRPLLVKYYSAATTPSLAPRVLNSSQSDLIIIISAEKKELTF